MHVFFFLSLLGAGYIVARNIILRSKIDDPIEAISVHAFGGMLSLFLAPILSEKYGMIYLATADRSLQYSSGDHGFCNFETIQCTKLEFWLKNFMYSLKGFVLAEEIR